jgi:two-component system, NtrC family, sensor kinase
MLNFRNLSLRRKQTLIMTLTSMLTLLLACVAFLGVEALNFRGELTDEISTMAQVAGNNCTAALDFNDPKAAEGTLGALRVEPPIASACIYNRRGEVFAVYQRDGKSTIAEFPPVQPPGQEFRDHQLRIFLPITVRGETVGTIYVTCDLYELNDRLKHFAVIAMLVLGISLLAAFFLSVRLQRVISGPVLQLAQAVRTVALEKNYSVRATKQSNDELGQLVDGFNEMLAQIQARDTALQTARDNLEKRVEERTRELEIIHKQLLEASRRGGMAEIATNVLHNVGNVLNSVNVSTGLIVESVKKSRASSLARVAVLLQEHTDDLGKFITNDPQGKHLPAYLAQLSEHLIADQKTLVNELDSLRRNVEHIKEIVATQQNYATFGGVKEIVEIVNLVEDSLCINEGTLRRHRVEIIREFEKVPPMNVEKHKILQILVNLLRNAKHACQESERTDKRLTVRVADGDGRVKISVMDNGIGIPPENLTRIFNHGFTTRTGGHGFGLHSGALAAKEMGGSLSVRSDGPGQGATFVLELPYTTNEGSRE